MLAILPGKLSSLSIIIMEENFFYSNVCQSKDIQCIRRIILLHQPSLTFFLRTPLEIKVNGIHVLFCDDCKHMYGPLSKTTVGEHKDPKRNIIHLL